VRVSRGIQPSNNRFSGNDQGSYRTGRGAAAPRPGNQKVLARIRLAGSEFLPADLNGGGETRNNRFISFSSARLERLRRTKLNIATIRGWIAKFLHCEEAPASLFCVDRFSRE